MGHDRFADIPQAERRTYIQRVLGLPVGGDKPPLETLDALIDLRLCKGSRAFYAEIGRMIEQQQGGPDGQEIPA